MAALGCIKIAVKGIFNCSVHRIDISNCWGRFEGVRANPFFSEKLDLFNVKFKPKSVNLRMPYIGAPHPLFSKPVSSIELPFLFI